MSTLSEYIANKIDHSFSIEEYWWGKKSVADQNWYRTITADANSLFNMENQYTLMQLGRINREADNRTKELEEEETNRIVNMEHFSECVN